jgi:hypothetical protein
MGRKLPLDVCSLSFKSTKETSYEMLGYKNMQRIQDIYMQSKNKATKNRFIQAYKMIIEMNIITTFNMFEAYLLQ